MLQTSWFGASQDHQPKEMTATFGGSTTGLSAPRLNNIWAVGTVQRPSIRATYRQYLQQGFTARRPVVYIPLGPNHIHTRPTWAVEHAGWRMQQWKHVMFSDKSRFCLHFHDGRVLVKRLPSERFLDACISEHDGYGDGVGWNHVRTAHSGCLYPGYHDR